MAASKGFQKLTLLFFFSFLVFFNCYFFAVIYYRINVIVNVCMPLLSMLRCRQQWKLCVRGTCRRLSAVRATSHPLPAPLQTLWGGREGRCCFRTLGGQSRVEGANKPPKAFAFTPKGRREISPSGTKRNVSVHEEVGALF